MRVFHYVVKLGRARPVETYATSKESAIKLVMAAYPGCPRSAVKVRRIVKRRKR